MDKKFFFYKQCIVINVTINGLNEHILIYSQWKIIKFNLVKHFFQLSQQFKDKISNSGKAWTLLHSLKDAKSKDHLIKIWIIGV